MGTIAREFFRTDASSVQAIRAAAQMHLIDQNALKGAWAAWQSAGHSPWN